MITLLVQASSFASQHSTMCLGSDSETNVEDQVRKIDEFTGCRALFMIEDEGLQKVLRIALVDAIYVLTSRKTMSKKKFPASV